MPGELRKTPELVRRCQELRAKNMSYEAIANELGIPNKSMVWKWLQTAESYLVDPEPHSTRHTFRKQLPEDDREKHLKIVNQKIAFYQKRTEKTKGSEREKNERLLLDFLKEHRLLSDDKIRQDLKNQRTLNVVLKRWLQAAGTKFIEGALDEYKTIRETAEGIESV